MIYHLALFQLKAQVDEEKIEWILRETRMHLLKIPEVRNLRCGKCVDDKAKWRIFLAVEIESQEKLALYMNNPVHVKFVEEILKPNITNRLALDYEMEPGKDIKYS